MVFQDSGHGVANLLPASALGMMALVQEGSKSICTQNFYYYQLRYRKTNGGHIGSILPISILTYLSSLASYFASAYQISSIHQVKRGGVMTSF